MIQFLEEMTVEEIKNLCGGAETLRAIKFATSMLEIICTVIPILLILMITISFGKNVIAGGIDDMKKELLLVIKKIIMCVAIFFVPSIISLAMGTLGKLGIDYTKCIEVAKKDDLSKYEIELEIEENKENYYYQDQKKEIVSNIKDSSDDKEDSDDSDSSQLNVETKNNIFIGDSRTVGMHLYGGVDKGDKWICESSMGYQWLIDTAIPELDAYLDANSKKHYNIFINLGINDLHNDKNYKKKFQELGKKLKTHNVIIVSVNPTNKAKWMKFRPGAGYISNAKVEAFNKVIKDAKNTVYCDTYNKVQFETSDGLHYTASTYKKIYKAMKQCVSNSTKKSSTTKSTTKSTNTSKTKKILFIGNSFTFRPGSVKSPTIPKMVAAMASKDGITLKYDASLKGGATLDGIWKDAALKKKIKKSYDYVVIQPRFRSFIKDNKSYQDPQLQADAAVSMAKALKGKNSKVKIYMRRVWSFDNKLLSFIEVYLGITAMEKSIDNLTFIDDGKAFLDTLKNYKNISIYTKDHYHQNINGAYLSSLCIYSKIFNKDPKEIEYVASGVEKASTLKEIAHNNCYK